MFIASAELPAGQHIDAAAAIYSTVTDLARLRG
ncbi:hypothetical protein ACVIWU_007044 [Bradyrhizobium sp. USDA 4509]